MRTGVSITVSAADRRRLAAIIADRNAAQRYVWRARIVLLSIERRDLGGPEGMRSTLASRPTRTSARGSLSERGSSSGKCLKGVSPSQDRGLTVEITTGFVGRERALIELFATTFTASEGPDEGAQIGGLVRDLLTATPAEDIRVFCAEDEGNSIGAAIFTRLNYSDDPHIVFLLSPMAVAPGRQRQGIGQTLLSHALEALSSEGIQIAITYGDPNYYRRAGFLPITEDQARAPLPLSLPHGWVGQSLTEERMPVLQGPSTCVSALNRSDVW